MSPDDVERYDPGDAGRSAASPPENDRENAGAHDPELPAERGRDVPHVDPPALKPGPRDVWAHRKRRPPP